MPKIAKIVDRSTMWVGLQGDLFARGCVVNDTALLAELVLPPEETVACIPRHHGRGPAA